MVVSAADFTPQGNISLRDTYGVTGATFVNATLYYGNASQMTGITSSTANSSTYWGTYHVATDLNNLLTLDWANITSKVASDFNYLVLSKWENITGRVTHLGNLTDDLGDRGYTHLGNFTDDLGDRGYTALSNFTDDLTYTNDTWVDTYFVRFSELVAQVGNYSAWDKAYSDLIGRPTSNLNFTNDAGYYNSSDFTIGDYALGSKVDSLGNYSAENSTIARIGDCGAGEFVQNTTTGGVECAAPAGGGTVTSVATDDSYLTGGAITSTGTITFNTTLAGTSLAANSSDYWDGLGSPSDINAGDITDDGTFSNDTWVDAYFVRFTELVDQIGNWSADKSSYSTTTEAGALYRAQSWDNFTGIPTATPANGDTTNLSTADHIYDFVIGLSYLADLSDDTSPELGGYLDTAGNNIGATDDEIENIYVGDTTRIYFGDGQDASVYFNGTNLIIAG